MQVFELHPRLERDTLFITDWALSRVLLMNDARFPWLLVVPRRGDVTEVHELAHAERMVLIEEVARAARALKSVAAATKINIASLGNVVPQLHVHIVARTPADAAWPNPVWGHGACVPYASGAADALGQRLKAAF
ncbi:MAG TPA: HIT family protein [Rhizomicrobium sp.]|jgi:diadenosine tetraphosphate (Ap4A) HIT family hydrolase